MTAPMRMACIALVVAAMPSHGQELGTLGPTYEISEPHLLRDITQRLRQLQASGELQRLQGAARHRAAASVETPAPIAGLRTTTRARSFHVDPSFTLDRNILGPRGELLFAAGLRRNPLDVVTLSKRLLFFDARDPRQVAQAQRLMERDPGRIKPVLTAGSYLDLMKQWRQPVYYDQQGRLVRRLRIAQVPALVSQEGARLRVDELEVAP